MKHSDFADKFKAALDGMSDEEFLAMAERDCPWLFGDDSPPPKDAMIPGPVTAPPTLDEFMQRDKKAAAPRPKRTPARRPAKPAAAVVSARSKRSTSVSRSKAPDKP